MPTLEQNLLFLIQLSILIPVIILLSIIQYKRTGRNIEDKELRKKARIRFLEFRFLAGFCMGWFDHIFMIWGGFHSYFWLVAYLYVISVYTAFMLLIPPELKKKQRKWFIPLWLIVTITFSSITEMSFRLFFLPPIGEFGYPIGWTPLTTVIFYIDVHCLGTFISTLQWDPRFDVFPSNETEENSLKI